LRPVTLRKWCYGKTNRIFILFEIFNFVGDKNVTLVDFIKIFSGDREFTYEYLKEEISGYHHEGNADGSKFKDFVIFTEEKKENK
jgi:hypothetical protein